jgi:anthranilate synthase component 1
MDSLEVFLSRARPGMVPVTREVVLDGDTPVSAFAKLHRGPYGFLLESSGGWGEVGPLHLPLDQSP